MDRSVELFSHQWGSHVCQTLLTLGAPVVDDEVKENGTDTKMGDSEELRSMQQLVLDMCEDIKPEMGALISQQYASHVIRVLLCVLAGKTIDEEGGDRGNFRSKKSANFRQQHNNSSAKKVSGDSGKGKKYFTNEVYVAT